MPKRRSPKGSVSVQVFKGWLRLVWTYQGKREFLYLGLPDNPMNLRIAEAKATQIYGDIQTGNYDPTLKKYKPEIEDGDNDETISSLLLRFREYKSKLVDIRTLEKYDALLKHLEFFSKRKKVSSVNHDDAIVFRDYLLSTMVTRTVREHLITLNAAWEWAELEKNPWEAVKDATKVLDGRRPDPFTKDEVEVILEEFRKNKKYYFDFVRWQFCIGTRPGEAIALRWEHFSKDCSSVWIGESYSRKKYLKPVKMNKSRTLVLPPEVQEMMIERHSVSSNELVFPAPRSGGYVDDHNFSQRIWKKILSETEIRHRKFYRTRSTFISHALQSGMHPVDVAAYVGDSVATIYRYYAGCINKTNKTPVLF